MTQPIEPEDDREYIEGTFHICEPIRSKPLPPEPHIPMIIIRQRGTKPLLTISERFKKINENSLENGILYEGDDDLIDGNGVGDDANFVDINDNNGNDKSGLSLQEKRLKILIAQKLKRKSIANRLGHRYIPQIRNRYTSDVKSQLSCHGDGPNSNPNSLRRWSEKFGARLQAMKLLHLPLLFRRYRSTGPFKSKQQLDIEIDLYMADVIKARKGKKKSLQTILQCNDTTTMTNDCHVIDASDKIKNLLKGFGGPKFKHRLGLTLNTCLKNTIVDDDDEWNLNDTIDNGIGDNDNDNDDGSSPLSKTALDNDLDNYWTEFRVKNIKSEPMTS